MSGHNPSPDPFGAFSDPFAVSTPSTPAPSLSGTGSDPFGDFSSASSKNFGGESDPFAAPSAGNGGSDPFGSFSSSSSSSNSNQIQTTPLDGTILRYLTNYFIKLKFFQIICIILLIIFHQNQKYKHSLRVIVKLKSGPICCLQ